MEESSLFPESKRLGLTQDEAGTACGVSREMWGKYERGKAVMGTDVLSRFAAAGADILYILTGARSATAQAAGVAGAQRKTGREAA
jgi:transcriptional regulator with XRE-family HTH domain